MKKHTYLSIFIEAYIQKHLHVSSKQSEDISNTCSYNKGGGEVGDLHPRNSRRLALSPPAPRTPPIYIYTHTHTHTHTHPTHTHIMYILSIDIINIY